MPTLRKGISTMATAMVVLVLSVAAINFARAYRIKKLTTRVSHTIYRTRTCELVVAGRTVATFCIDKHIIYDI
ncbi:hypothetical protein RA16_03180 [Levilactobacillus brevis]|nr:hypothetical protein RA16_03180 [Levilactobacillus brevis]